MEKEKQEDIDYNKILLIKKYKSMYKKHNKYHPSNLHFLSLPPSLKFSSFTQKYYEFVKQNTYLGNKIKEIQKSPGNYNKEKNLKEYKRSKTIGDKLVESSKYKNLLLNLISPFTYEKRLNKLIENSKNKKTENNDDIEPINKNIFINRRKVRKSYKKYQNNETEYNKNTVMGEEKNNELNKKEEKNETKPYRSVKSIKIETDYKIEKKGEGLQESSSQVNRVCFGRRFYKKKKEDLKHETNEK
jgi:hypothetical protein